MELRRVLEKWNEFAAVVLPVNCDPHQRLDMMASFFAGAIVVMDILVESNTAEGQRKQFTELLAETLEFGKDVGRENPTRTN